MANKSQSAAKTASPDGLSLTKGNLKRGVNPNNGGTTKSAAGLHVGGGGSGHIAKHTARAHNTGYGLVGGKSKMKDPC